MDILVKHDQFAWDEYFLRAAALASTMSKDPDRKVGAVLVTPGRRQQSPGYNGFPPGMPDLQHHLADRAFKRANMVHAEDNCLRQAPFKALGCTMYITRFPCDVCAAKLVKAGVRRVVAPRPEFGHPRWGDSWRLAYDLLDDASIDVSFHEVLDIGS